MNEINHKSIRMSFEIWVSIHTQIYLSKIKEMRTGDYYKETAGGVAINAYWNAYKAGVWFAENEEPTFREILRNINTLIKYKLRLIKEQLC